MTSGTHTAGLHFAREALTESERSILHVAESLLHLIDESRTDTSVIATAFAADAKAATLLDNQVVLTHGPGTSARPQMFPDCYSHRDIAQIAPAAGIEFTDARSRYTHHTPNTSAQPPR